MIPSEIRKVKKYEDFLPFCDWLLQHLGGKQRYVLYRINMTSSPHPRYDIEANKGIEQNCPEEVIQWERAIYRILKNAFQNFIPVQYIFLQHRMEHSLYDSRLRYEPCYQGNRSPQPCALLTGHFFFGG
jgi:hypothetical protein